MTTSTTKKTDGLKALEVAIENIRAEIIRYEGEFKVIMAPKLVTAIDEADLARRLERAEAENAQVAGDDDEEDGADQEGMQFDPEKEFNHKNSSSAAVAGGTANDDDDEDEEDEN